MNKRVKIFVHTALILGVILAANWLLLHDNRQAEKAGNGAAAIQSVETVNRSK